MEEPKSVSSNKVNDEASYLKFAKFVAALRSRDADTGCIAEILKCEGDVNYVFPLGRKLKSGMYSIPPGAMLHQLKCDTPADIFRLLLSHGADITKKNTEGETALHVLLFNIGFPGFSAPIVAAYLSAHIERSIPENPRAESTGISHLHVACLAGHASAVEFFLANGADVNEAIERDLCVFPGCTPLHLAAVERSCLETVKKLLRHGADVRRRDARGSTPLCALIISNMQRAKITPNDQRIIQELLTSESGNDGAHIRSWGFSTFHAACTLDDVSLAESLLAHVEDVDQAIGANSPFCPGYTALHFAAHFNVDLVKFLIDKQANLLARDASGVTPLDLCAQRYSLEDVHYIISRQPSLRDITFSDGKKKLLELLRAMQCVTSFEEFLDELEDVNLRLDEASPAWSGYSPLHFAVLFFEQVQAQGGRSMIAICLDRGADCCTRDARGSSPLHLAFHLQKKVAISEMFASSRQIADSTDEDNVSHLIVACVVDGDDDEHPVRRLVRAGADVNLATRSSVEFDGKKFAAKSSPLHVLVADNKPETARFLIEHGADLNATDEDGWSPVHRLMGCIWPRPSSNSQPGIFLDDVLYPKNMARVLLSFPTKLEERVVEGVGPSHLHVACRFDDLRAVKLLLDLGSDVNATIGWDARPAKDDPHFRRVNKGCTPLHFALRRDSIEITNILLESGADILARSTATIPPLYEVMLNHKRGLYQTRGSDGAGGMLGASISRLRSSEDLQRRLKEDSGMTLLHILAFAMDKEGVEELIDNGLDVNAQLQSNSPIWPGSTPLHAWIYGSRDTTLKKDNVAGVLRALLDAGADVTISDSKLNTPLHSMLRSLELAELNDNCVFSNARATMCSQKKNESILSHASTILRSQKDFSVNPVNADGISHFHLAVRMNEATAVEGFLKNGADVNQRTDVFRDYAAGCASLQLLGYGLGAHSDESWMKMAELLLSYGADVRARDIHGNTPLHALVKNPFQRVQEFERCVQAGYIPLHLLANRPVCRQKIFELFVCAGAEIHATNYVGRTPFDVAFRAGLEAEEISFYLRQGYRLNTFNPIDESGFLATALIVSMSRSLETSKKTFQLFFEHEEDIVSTDYAGRTAIHNIVSTYLPMDLSLDDRLENASSKNPITFADVYERYLRELVHLGCDVDAQDRTGKTALHAAVHFRNCDAVRALLRTGVDINLVDAEGKSALEYAVSAYHRGISKERQREESCIIAMVHYLEKMMRTRLGVSQKNRDLVLEVLQKKEHEDNDQGLKSFLSCLKGTKRICIADSISLYSMMSETSAVAAYPTMPHSRRSAIDNYFASNVESLKGDMDLIGMLELQCRKMVKRAALIQSAHSALRVLSALPLPELVCEELARYLGYYDIRNLVAIADNKAVKYY